MKGEEQEQILLGPDLVLVHLSESDTPPKGLLEDMRSHCAQSVAKDDKLPRFWSLQDFYPPVTEPRCFAKDGTRDKIQSFHPRMVSNSPVAMKMGLTLNSCPSASTFSCWDCRHETIIASFESLAFNTKGISKGTLAHLLPTPRFLILVPSKEI